MSETTPINHADRLGLTLFFAITLHTAIILGLGFDVAQPKQRTAERTLEIMVVHNPHKSEPPKEADYLAQISQQGSGSQKAPIKPKSQPDPLPHPKPVKVPVPQTRASTTPVPPKPQQRTTLASKNSPKKMPATPPKPPLEKKQRLTAAQLLDSTSREITRLTAQLNRRAEDYAKQPRRKSLNAASTQEYNHAAYLAAWERKVERIGNLNYPEEAKQRKLYGTLRLRVGVRADGSIERIQLLQSSGHKLLDDAAIRIVELAAPFAPFPAAIRKETDILDITRTWQFLSSNRLGWKE